MSRQPATELRHIPWAFSLSGAPSLPVTGDRHPLRLESRKWLTWANVAALLLGLAIFGAWSWWSRRDADQAPVVRQVKIVRYTDLGVPPSISRPSAPQVNIAHEIAKIVTQPPRIAIPEPVADDQAQTQTIATQTEMAAALEPVSLGDLGVGTGGDSLVVDVDIETSPSPDDFIAVDEDPVRLRIDPPVYPDVARAAGIEGTVLVRVLVSKEGKIKDAIVVDGPEPLREAADRCARTAVFKPAVVDNKPIEVWVLMPVTFKLR